MQFKGSLVALYPHNVHNQQIKIQTDFQVNTKIKFRSLW